MALGQIGAHGMAVALAVGLVWRHGREAVLDLHQEGEVLIVEAHQLVPENATKMHALVKYYLFTYGIHYTWIYIILSLRKTNITYSQIRDHEEAIVHPTCNEDIETTPGINNIHSK